MECSRACGVTVMMSWLCVARLLRCGECSGYDCGCFSCRACNRVNWSCSEKSVRFQEC